VRIVSAAIMGQMIAIRQRATILTAVGLAAVSGVDRAAASERSVRAAGSVGVAVALEDYEAYGLGHPIRAGVDLPLFRSGQLRHRLSLTLEYAHFWRSFLREPELIPGLQLDVGSLRATWRVFPFDAHGLHADVGSGVAVIHDRVAFELEGRTVRSSETRWGLPLEVGIGWTIGEYFDAGLRYTRLALLSGEGAATLGYPELVLGLQR